MLKKILRRKLDKGEMIITKSNTRVVLSKWRDKRDVYFLSTKHRPQFQSVPPKSGKMLLKTLAICDYNDVKTFIDVSDQHKSYGSSLKCGEKWYRKMAIEILPNTTVINAHILFMSVTSRRTSTTQFRENLAEAH